jgi:arylsulfatase A-like enzyme
MKTSVLVLTALLLATPATLRAADAPQPSGKKPNIVFIFADDWGWGDLSCHGHPYLKTPNLDRLASEGIEFHQFNVLNPVCSPSRTATMTGQFPARWSVHQHFASVAQNHQRGMPDWLDPKAPMLPRILQEVGYRTGHFGKWHLTSEMVPDGPPPAAYGFDEFKGFNYSKPNAKLLDTADNAVAFIRANKDRPFYVNVWLHESHTPHVPTKESLARWQQLPERQRIYAAVITDGDNEVGKVIATLRELGLEKNTIILFSSDNGPEWTGGSRQMGQGFGTFFSVGSTGGLRGRKRSLFEGGVSTPFIVRWPGHTPVGQVDKHTVFTAVDLLPTLCAAAGVSLPAGYKPDGENLLPALTGQEMQRTKPIFWEWQGTAKEPDWWPRLSVREGDWKLVQNSDGSRRELYNEADDRPEKQNVAASHPEIVTRLSKMVLAWKATLPKSPPAGCLSHGGRAKTGHDEEQ